MMRWTRLQAVLMAMVLPAAMPVAVAAQGQPLRGMDGWIREAPPVAPVRAGYVELVNDGGSPVVVVGADSPAFGAVEIHEMIAGDNDAMRMRKVPRLAVPARGRVGLEPGGLHLMLFRPQQPLAPGSTVPVRLHTEAGAVVELSLQVR